MFRKALSFVLLAVSICMSAGVVPAGTLSRSNLADSEFQIFDLVNREREGRRLGELRWDDRLADMAREYSRQMARGNFFSHYDEAGLTVIDRADRMRIRGWNRIGENLFLTTGMRDLAPFAIRGWLGSPTHRTNMLDRGWTSTGIGIAQTRDGRVYITEVFTEDD
jgi:uncharacterized protein YkwD